MRAWFLIILVISLTGLNLQAQTSGRAPTIEAYKGQIDSLTAEIESDPMNTKLYVHKAELIYRLNQIYRAQPEPQYKLARVVEVIDKAIEIAPSDPYLYSVRGSYKKLIYGDKAGAIVDLTKAIELNPNNPDWYFNRANYKSVEDACLDWQACSDLGDYRCVKIYEQLCVSTP